jgi:hypothetical protein
MTVVIMAPTLPRASDSRKPALLGARCRNLLPAGVLRCAKQ